MIKINLKRRSIYYHRFLFLSFGLNRCLWFSISQRITANVQLAPIQKSAKLNNQTKLALGMLIKCFPRESELRGGGVIPGHKTRWKSTRAIVARIQCALHPKVWGSAERKNQKKKSAIIFFDATLPKTKSSSSSFAADFAKDGGGWRAGELRETMKFTLWSGNERSERKFPPTEAISEERGKV